MHQRGIIFITEKKHPWVEFIYLQNQKEKLKEVCVH